MTRRFAALFALLALVVGVQAHAAETWTEGKNYFVISPPQRTSVPPGKVEVTEVFSYGCPYCYQTQGFVTKLKAALPPNAQLVYLPASFIPRENWPMFQRAFFAAQALGILEKTHAAMFDAVWKTGELGISDPATNRLKSPMPTLQDAAKFYARVGGVTPEAFIAAANSFSVEAKMRAADATVVGAQALSTPTFLVNGKYRLNAETAGSYDKLIELVKFLVAKEAAAPKAVAAKP
jgi:protein dithiol oxidoreductase (disulfide-forming)